MSNHNRTALITGASSGIGRALSVEFAKDGYDVVLTARSEQRLEEIAVERRGAGADRVAAVGLSPPHSTG